MDGGDGQARTTGGGVSTSDSVPFGQRRGFSYDGGVSGSHTRRDEVVVESSQRVSTGTLGTQSNPGLVGRQEVDRASSNRVPSASGSDDREAVLGRGSIVTRDHVSKCRDTYFRLANESIVRDVHRDRRTDVVTHEDHNQVIEDGRFGVILREQSRRGGDVDVVIVSGEDEDQDGRRALGDIEDGLFALQLVVSGSSSHDSEERSVIGSGVVPVGGVAHKGREQRVGHGGVVGLHQVPTQMV